jgi:uncharacterized protein YecT (DUF1311 family)
MKTRRALSAILMLMAVISPAFAQQRDEEEGGWVGFVEGIETCLASKKPLLTLGYACIGQFSAACLKHAENQTTAGMARCYLDEYRAWDVLLNRHYKDRPKGAGGQELQQVQRAWLAYREKKCAYFNIHYAGGSMAGWLAAQCMMDTTARRAIELRFFAMDR